MKVWTEYEEDAYKYFEWSKDEMKESENIGIPKLSVYSINILGANIAEQHCFITEASEKICKILKQNKFKDYKVYLFANVEVVNYNSKVEHYMKVWKVVSKKYDISNFILGDEVLVKSDKEIFYSSVAEIPLSLIDKAMKIVISNPDKYTLVLSKVPSLLMSSSIQDMFESMIQCNKFWKIDYYAFSVRYCARDDIIVRFGTDFTSAEFAFIFSAEMFNSIINTLN